MTRRRANESAPAATGWVGIEVDFGEAVTLDGITAQTEHSGAAHHARSATIQAGDGERYVDVGQFDLPGPDARMSFARATGRIWRLRFQAGPTHCVVVRGLQF